MLRKNQTQKILTAVFHLFNVLEMANYRDKKQTPRCQGGEKG